MDCLLIKGGVPLRGDVTISGAKNAVLPLMAATLPEGCGSERRSTPVEKPPKKPELRIWPPTTRPIEPERQRLPTLPPGWPMKPDVSLQRK